MQARILKECRALLPMWGVALLLMVAPILVWPATRDGDSVLVFGVFGFGLSAVLLSVASFGREFAYGTYGLLLAQPVSRWRLWWEKTLVLGVALGSSLLVFMGTVSVFLLVRDPFNGPFANWSVGELALLGLLLAGTAYGGGLCLTLLLRQANGAFWLALFFPAAVCLGVGALTDKFWGGEVDTGRALIVALIVYSVVSYALGLRLFLKRQDVAWLAGDVTIPLAPAWFVGRAAEAQPGRRFGALAALLYKELHLQQVNLLGGVLFALLFAGTVAAARSDLKFFDIPVQDILLGFFFLIWALMPFLIGAVTIVEERRLGILEWQQSLPISRRRQYGVKLLVACGVSLILAALLPWQMEETARFWTRTTPLGRAALELKMLLPWAVAVPLATLVGVFASSLTRNLLHALSLVVGLVAVSWLLAAGFALAFSPVLPLVAIIGLPGAFVVLWVLAFRNYCEPALGGRLWLKNLSVLLAMFGVVFGTSMGLYLRKWEVLLPDPTRISTVHVTGPAESKIICHGKWGQTLVLLPGGTLWQWRRWEGRTLADPPALVGTPGQWRDVATANVGMGLTRPAIAAIKPDGTLWWWGQEPPAQAELGAKMSREMMMRYGLLPPSRDPGKGDGTTAKAEFPAQTEPPAQAEPGAKMSREMMRRYGLRPAVPQPLRSLGTEPTQIGSGHDWTAIEAGDSHFLALKTDGTLWAWGNNFFGQLGDDTTDSRAQPVRIGSDTNWARVAGGRIGSAAVKRDGSLWLWGDVMVSDKTTGARHVSVCAPRRLGDGTNWVSAVGDETGWGVQTDGSLWYLGEQLFYAWSTNPAPLPASFRTVSGGLSEYGRGWAKFAWGSGRVVGLKKDGSLWGAEPPPFNWGNWGRDPFSFLVARLFVRHEPAQKSGQRPWIAVAAGPGESSFALAADGSLWTWGQPLDRPRPWLIHYSNRPHLVARLAEPESR